MTGEQFLSWMSDNLMLLIIFWLGLAMVLLFLYYQGKVSKLNGKVKMLENDLRFQMHQNEELKEQIKEEVSAPVVENITQFEKEQEETSIISYEELVKAVRGTESPKEEIIPEVKQEEKKFKATEVISPVFGYQQDYPDIKGEPKTMKKDDLESFLSSLIELRKKLE